MPVSQHATEKARRYHSRECMDAWMYPCRCGADPVTLLWEDAGTDEPGDQNSWNSRVPHAIWTVGPSHPAGMWSVTLILKDEHGDELDSIRLADQSSEDAAKAIAQEYETCHFSPVKEED